MNARTAAPNLMGIMAQKGEAAPTIPKAPVEATSASQPEIKVGVPVARSPRVSLPEPAGQAYFKALTLKLDRERFTSLKMAGVSANKTSQTILVEALDLWFKRNKGD